LCLRQAFDFVYSTEKGHLSDLGQIECIGDALEMGPSIIVLEKPSLSVILEQSFFFHFLSVAVLASIPTQIQS
jgi:hypothetical protein